MPAKKSYDEDLFKESTMTFGEHLEELRWCLMKCAIGLFCGVLVGVAFSEWVVGFIQSPLTRALERYYQTQATEDLARYYPNASPDKLAVVQHEHKFFDRVYIEPGALVEQLKGSYPELGGVAVPGYQVTADDLLDARSLAEEIRRSGEAANPSPAHKIWSLLTAAQRDQIAAIAASAAPTEEQRRQLAQVLNGLLSQREFYDRGAFAPIKHRFTSELNLDLESQAALVDDALRRMNWQLLAVAFPSALKDPHPHLVPLLIWRDVAEDARAKPKSMSMQEPFMVWLKAALFAGAVLSSPWLFYQIWSFVAAGLYPHEKKYVHLFLPFSLGLFLIGAALAFFFVFEYVLDFLLSYNRSLGIAPEPRINEWLGFALLLPIGFGIAFQLPLVMLFLDRIGVMSVQLYLSYWRAAVFVIFVLAAILTPADPYSMLFMAVPLTILFFFGILLCRYLPGERNRYQRRNDELRTASDE